MRVDEIGLPVTYSSSRHRCPHTGYRTAFTARCYAERGYEIVSSSVRPSVRVVEVCFSHRLEYF